MLAPKSGKAVRFFERMAERKALIAAALPVARAVQTRTGVLRGETAGWVAWAIWRHVAAGWGVDDILAALDWQPSGRRWDHSGLGRAKHPARAAGARLAHWCDIDGQPLPSAARRAEAERLQCAAQARARREQAERDRAAGRGLPRSRRSASGSAPRWSGSVGIDCTGQASSWRPSSWRRAATSSRARRARAWETCW